MLPLQLKIKYEEWYDVMEFLRTLDTKPMDTEQNEYHKKRYHDIAQLALKSKNGYIQQSAENEVTKYYGNLRWDTMCKLVHFGEQHGYHFNIICLGEDGNTLVIKKVKI